MKKIFLTTFIIIAATVFSTAQDTLSADSLKSSYLCDQWPDFTMDSIIMNLLQMEPLHEKVEGQMFGTDGDTITVYGMAVGAETFTLEVVQSAIWGSNGTIIGYYNDSTYYYQELNSMCDTSAYEEAYELFGLYKRVADTLQQASPQLQLNIKLDTPTYILTFNSYTNGFYTEHTPSLPVYELFFHTPQQMTGSFFVCHTDRIHAKGGEADCKKRFYTWPLYIRMIAPTKQSLIERWTAYYYTNPITGDHWVFKLQPLVFTFPIIAPPDSGYVWDTTVVAGDTVFSSGDTVVFNSGDTLLVNGDTTVIVGNDTVFLPGGSVVVRDTSIVFDTTIMRDTIVVGGDTIVYYDTIIRCDTIVSFDILLSVSERDIMDRLTAITPNPASEKARVVSSLGINSIEVFNMAGRRIYEKRFVEGTATATLDIRHWPTGTYMVNIRTPQGIANRKLVVRH